MTELKEEVDVAELEGEVEMFVEQLCEDVVACCVAKSSGKQNTGLSVYIEYTMLLQFHKGSVN